MNVKDSIHEFLPKCGNLLKKKKSSYVKENKKTKTRTTKKTPLQWNILNMFNPPIHFHNPQIVDHY